MRPPTKRNISILLTLCLILLCADFSVFADDKTPQLFKPTDIFMSEPFWGEGFQGFLDKTHAAIIGQASQPSITDKDYEEKYRNNIRMAHEAGLKYTVCLSTIDIEDSYFDYSSRPELANSTCIDINGRKIIRGPSGSYWYCINNPIWQSFVLEIGERSISWGADGVSFDEIDGSAPTLNEGINGCFCPNCMEGFRKYIAKKYSPSALSKLGIQTTAAFNYGDYIKKNWLRQYNSPNNSRYNIPLFMDFLDYQHQSAISYYSNLAKQLREYGKKLNKSIYISANTYNMDPRSLAASDDYDYLSSELTLKYPSQGKNIPFYKLGAAMQKPVYGAPHSLECSELMARSDMSELMKLYTAEAYSSGGFLNVPYRMWYIDSFNAGGKGNFRYADLDRLKPYYDFIYENKQCYESLSSTASIAVLYSYPSARYQLSGFTDNYYGICSLLLDSHLQYDSLFCGDNDWIKDKLTLSSLQKYKAVVLPNTTNLSQQQLNLLLTYMQSGGQVFAFGDTGSYDEKNSKAKRDSLSKLLVEGRSTYGKGTFIYVNDKIGSRYLSNTPFPSKGAIVKQLSSLTQNDISTSADSSTVFESYWNTAECESIIHVLNYNYDLKAKKINIQKNISLQVKPDSRLNGKQLGIYYVSPDFGDIKELPYTVSGGRLSFRIPELQYYGVVVIGQKDKFAADWKLTKLKSKISEWKMEANEPIMSQYNKALELYRAASYTLASPAADKALAAALQAEAAQQLKKAQNAVSWSQRVGRSYKLSEAVPLLDSAKKSISLGKYQEALDYSLRVCGLLAITVDGRLDDWAGMKPIVQDPAGDSLCNGTDIQDIYASCDGEYLYIAATVRGQDPFIIFNLDYNGDNLADFSINLDSRYGCNTYMYSYSSGGCTNVQTQAELLSKFTAAMEIKVPLSSIGSPAAIRLNAIGIDVHSDFSHCDFLDGWYDIGF